MTFIGMELRAYASQVMTPMFRPTRTPDTALLGLTIAVLICTGIRPVALGPSTALHSALQDHTAGRDVELDSGFGTVLATIPVGSQPTGGVYDPVSGDVYVANSGSDNISVLSNTSVSSTFIVGTGPGGGTYDPSNGYLYILDENCSSIPCPLANVSVISGSTVVGTIPVGAWPIAALYDSVNRDVYVANYDSSNVSVLSGATLVKTIPVGKNPIQMAYNLTTGNVYVANSNSGNLTVISGTSNSVVATINIGGYPTGIVYDPWNSDIYVGSVGCGSVSSNVSIVSGTSLVKNITVGCNAYVLTYDSWNRAVYVLNDNSDTVSAISSSSNTVIATVHVGTNPYSAAVDSATGNLYVANVGSGNVSVVDAATNTVASAIAVGSSPFGVTYDRLNGYLYVANSGTNSVSVLNPPPPTYGVSFTEWGLPSGTQWFLNITGGPSLGSNTAVIALNEPNGTYSYTVATANKEYSVSGGSVTVAGSPVFDSLTFSLSNAVGSLIQTWNVGANPEGLAYDNPNGHIYVTNWGSSNVSVFNTTTSQFIATVPVGAEPASALYDPSNGLVYISDSADWASNITVINGTNDSVVASIPPGIDANSFALDTANGHIFVGGFTCFNNFCNITVINDSTNRVIQSIPADVSTDPGGMAFDSSNGYIYAAGEGGSDATVLNGASNQVIGTVQTGVDPAGVAYDKATGNLYVVNTNFSRGPGNVTVINGATETVTAWIQVGMYPDAVTYDPENGYIYVANQGSNNIVVINGTTNQLVGWIGVGSDPFALACDGNNGLVYAANWGSDTVSVVRPVTPASYGVTFTEVGLPPGTMWFVNLSNGISFSSETTQIAFNEPDGSYTFTVGSANKEWATPPGDFSVTGKDTSVTVTFTEVTYNIEFTETGLPIGTTWYVNLTGQASESSTGVSITIPETNGTYSYTLGTTDKGYVSAASRVTVKGSAISEPVAFSLVTYALTFTENGLPSGTEWWVNGTVLGSQSSVSTTIALDEPNGTYTYVVATTDKEYSAMGGSLRVNGASVPKLIPFSLVSYTVTFMESGLPSGTNWSVTAEEVTHNSTGATVVFNEPNASYTFTVGSVSGYAANRSSGSVRVNGTNVSVLLAFTSLSKAPAILGLPAEEGYALVGGIVAVVAAALVVAVILPRQRGRTKRTSPQTSDSARTPPDKP